MDCAGETDQSGEKIRGAGFHYYATAGEDEPDFCGGGYEANTCGEGYWVGVVVRGKGKERRESQSWKGFEWTDTSIYLYLQVIPTPTADL